MEVGVEGESGEENYGKGLEIGGRSQIVVKWEDWVGTHLRRELWERRGLWKVEGGAQWEDWDILVIQGGGGWHQGQRDESRRTKLRNRLGGGEHCQK